MKKYFIIRTCLLAIIPIYILINIAIDHSRISYNDVAKHGEDVSIVVKFGESSSNARFIVYDNHSREVIGFSKCAHGSGGGSTVNHPVFSNKIGSKCSSLGEYKLRCRSKMHNFEKDCIRIDGLSSTNSNAACRGITIHTTPLHADFISTGFPIPVSPNISQGCFGISIKTFNQLCELLREGKTIYLYADNERLR